jgi:hypothetical protein
VKIRSDPAKELDSVIHDVTHISGASTDGTSREK